VRVRFAGYGIYVFGERDAFAGETGHRQVEAVPEEVHGALLAVKPPGVFIEDLIRPGEYAVEAPHVRLLAGGVIGIVLQSVLVVEVEGPSVYGNVYPRRAESLHKLAVELRHGKVVYREPEPSALAGRDHQPVVEKVEGDVEGPGRIRDRTVVSPRGVT
jgi:hypothetical protein